MDVSFGRSGRYMSFVFFVVAVCCCMLLYVAVVLVSIVFVLVDMKSI